MFDIKSHLMIKVKESNVYKLLKLPSGVIKPPSSLANTKESH